MVLFLVTVREWAFLTVGGSVRAEEIDHDFNNFLEAIRPYLAFFDGLTSSGLADEFEHQVSMLTVDSSSGKYHFSYPESKSTGRVSVSSAATSSANNRMVLGFIMQLPNRWDELVPAESSQTGNAPKVQSRL